MRESLQVIHEESDHRIYSDLNHASLPVDSLCSASAHSEELRVHDAENSVSFEQLTGRTSPGIGSACLVLKFKTASSHWVEYGFAL